MSSRVEVGAEIKYIRIAIDLMGMGFPKTAHQS